MKNHRVSRFIVALLVLQSLFCFSIVPAMAEQSAASQPKQTAESNNSLFGLNSGFLGGLLNIFSSPQSNVAPADEENALWTETDKEGLRSAEIQARRQIFPVEYRVLRLDENALRGLLAATPHERAISLKDSLGEISLPLPAGGFGRFRIVEAPIMEDALAAQFPENKSYAGQGIDDPTATARFGLNPSGFHAQILSASGAAYVDTYMKGDTSLYIAYDKRDLPRGDKLFECLVKGAAEKFENDAPSAIALSHGTTLRTYRLALAATGEYTQFNGGTVAGARDAIDRTMTRVNGLYNRYFAVQMNLVANNNLLIYTDANTDPYTNSNGNTMLGQNQTNVDAVIGSSNYDIGHVFSTGGGGIATLRSPCNSSTKARGVTGASSPFGDPFDVDFVAHEIGHQFGGNHTFNALHAQGSGSNCHSGTRVPEATVEPGSGSTIQAYAGICPPADLQPNTDPYFHNFSLGEMTAFMTNASTGDSCAARSATNNNVPTVSGGSDYTIPPNTPFTLTATGSDADGDTLTYTWEQMNSNPLFRSRLPNTNASRTFPSMQYTLDNANQPPATYPCNFGGTMTNCMVGETLPGTSGTMVFKVTAYDNRAAAGAFADDTVSITVAGSPFRVTSPNTAGVSWDEGSQQTVTWDVGGGASAENVKISLSADGGQTFPFVLAPETQNDGSQSIFVPNVGPTGTTQARIKVEAVGNVFFDVSDQNFTIVEFPVYTVSGRITMPSGGLENITVQLDRGGLEPRTTKTNANGDYVFNFVPANANYTITPSSQQHVFGPAIHTTGILTANVTRDFIARTGRTYTWTQLTQVIAIQEGNPQQIQRNNHWNNFYNWSPYGIPGADDRIIVNDTPRIYQPPGGLDPITYNPQGLSLNGVAYSINGFSLDGNSITGGILTLGGDIPGSSQMKHGLLDLVLNVNAGATFDWNGGTFHSAATVAQNGFFLVTGTGERTIGRDGVVINNAGEMLWSGSPTITMLPNLL
jgi:hypothetical protein